MGAGAVIKGVQHAEEFALTMMGGQPAGAWFEAVFREHYPRVVAAVARLIGDRSQAEEIASDAFSKLSRQRAGIFRREFHPLAWVYRVAVNGGLDALRSNARRRKREEPVEADRLRAADSGALEGMLRAERCARVRAVLAELKPRDAQLLLLRAEGMAYRELAEAIGVQASSVGTLLARAEAEFERRFRARYGDDV